MKEFSYVITDSEGIHARPAGELVKVAKNYSSDIKLVKDGKEADCKKIFAIMGLGIKQNQEVIVRITGDDEEVAINSIEEFMKNNM